LPRMVTPDKRPNGREIIRFLGQIYPYFRLSGRSIAAVSVAMAIMGLSSMAHIHLLRAFMDSYGQSREQRFFWALFGIFVGATALRTLSQYSLALKTLHVKRALEESIKHDVFEKYQRMSHDFFVRNSTGVILNRINREADVLVMGFDSFSLLLQDLVVIVSMLLTALYLDPKLTLLSLTIVPPAAFAYRNQLKAVRSHSRDLQQASAAVNQRIIENLNGFRVVRIFQGERQEVAKFMEALRRTTENMFGMNRQLQRVGMINNLMKLTGGGLIIFVTGIASRQSEASIGSMVGFVMALTALYGPVGRLFNHYGSLQRMVGMGEKLLADLAMETTVKDRGTLELQSEPQEIRFEGVSFRYQSEGRDRLILQDVSFSVKRGEVIAILGPNGSGKSTLLNLLPRIYEPTAGRITADGMDLSSLKLQSLRSRIATVSQDMFLFDDTIFANIQYGKPGSSREEVEAASRMANAHAFISSLPEGYETRAGERGVMLSEGQKQRIAIARAFLKNAPILLLDEPTSALDIESKSAVTAALASLMKNRIVFLVTHQTSVITPGTRVFNLMDGRLVPTAQVPGASQVPAAHSG
jgi:ATP-binding cassette, subfamily B, bacterial MsbA